ncbi:MAG: histidine kinase [Proteobacteria bacterium]|jgi:predicted nicotinamide N-methyase|nr:histidine kinase [Pseudomonadota bacterium]MDA1299535.1 histidine kinase [Pseudomonadota bacterium]
MRIRYRYQNFTVGDIDIRLRVPRDLEQFNDPDRARQLGIQRDAFPFFGVVWESGELLARLMQGYDVSGKRILEIGCGMALASHVLNVRGANITAMDIHPLVGEFIEYNAALNRAPAIPFVAASWSEGIPEAEPFDLILGSDILYEPRHVRTLPAFIDHHLGATGEVLLINPDRGQDEDFHRTLLARGFSCESLPEGLINPESRPYHVTGKRYRRR